MALASSSQPHPGLDGALTRERLLDAAESLFAERGFHAASVREITQAAGSNLAAVNYHFGSKANLYRAVFLRRLAELRDRRVRAIDDALRSDGSDLAGLLHRFARVYLSPAADGKAGSHWPRLALREQLDPQLSPELFAEEIVEPIQAALARALVSTTPGLEPELARLCVRSLVGQLTHLRRLHGYLASVGAAATGHELDLPAAIDHVVRFSAAAIRSLAGQS